jgi:hypothetical protein
MMQDVAKWFCLFAVMLIGFAGTLRVLFSTPDAAHLLEGTPDFCFERQDGTGQVTYVFSWAFRLFEAMFNLGNLQDCLRASSWGRAISYFFLLFIYVVMLNLCVTPPLILGYGRTVCPACGHRRSVRAAWRIPWLASCCVARTAL